MKLWHNWRILCLKFKLKWPPVTFCSEINIIESSLLFLTLLHTLLYDFKITTLQVDALTCTFIWLLSKQTLQCNRQLPRNIHKKIFGNKYFSVQFPLSVIQIKSSARDDLLITSYVRVETHATRNMTQGK